MSGRLVAITLLAWLVVARGVTFAAVADERARAVFQRGLQEYVAGDYRGALASFEEAKRIAPRPAFDFNIGRSLEKLERWHDAVEAYERYLRAAPNAEDAEELRGRVRVLRELERRQQELVVARGAAPTPTYKKWWVWTTVGLVVAGGLAVGLGVGLTQGGTPSAATTDGTFRPFQ